MATMGDLGGYVVLAHKTLANAPGSGATVTLWDSTLNAAAWHGARYKHIIVGIISSANSAANGIVLSASSDKGTTWDVANNSNAYATASGLVTTFLKCAAPDLKLEYINSAAVLTTWRVFVLGDPLERSNG